VHGNVRRDQQPSHFREETFLGTTARRRVLIGGRVPFSALLRIGLESIDSASRDELLTPHRSTPPNPSRHYRENTEAFGTSGLLFTDGPELRPLRPSR